jgi:Tannase-like family of unknown function (DUF6351)
MAGGSMIGPASSARPVAAFDATAARTSAPAVRIVVLSSRADLVSGGEALVRVIVGSGNYSSIRRIDVNGRNVTSAFAVRRDGQYTGLVSGLTSGANDLRVRLRSGAGARMTLTNHPSGGPLFSGPHVRPWRCNAGARNGSCDRAPTYEYYYVPVGVDPEAASGPIGSSPGSDPYFQPYDPASPPPPALIATTTTDEGRTVPFIVRLETGTVNRGQYQIAVLFDPAKPWTLARPQTAWDRKLFMVGGPNCGVSYQEGSSPGVLHGKVLGRGFATLSHTLMATGNNCNLVTQAESLAMTKEHFVEAYGTVRYTMSIGGSGASVIQQWIANAYPGLYDGLVVEASFPDAWTALVNANDCISVVDYWNDPTRWAPGVAWGPAEQSAVANGDAPSSCVAFTAAFKGMLTPADESGQVAPGEAYDPETRPSGTRGTIWDYSVAQLGRRPASARGATEQDIGRGFANRPLDTVGILFGLRALDAGQITPAQFVDLNAKVGGRDIDYEPTKRRTAADPLALERVYRSGYLNQANNLHVPIIDIRGASNSELHDSFRSWSMRARLDRANGHHRNQVIWNSFTASGFIVDPALEAEAFDLMDQWLDAIDQDRSARTFPGKVAANKPDAAVDRCTHPGTGQPGPCIVPDSGTPRLGAGQPLVDDVAKCQLKPLRRADYSPASFTDDQWSQLRRAFPTGVCDYTKAGVNQRRTVPWLTYRTGPGGQPLGPAPVSQILR